MEAARPLVAVRGFSAVGISQILEVAGIPKGSFYHYFESKEAFGEELLRCYIENYVHKMDDVFAVPRRTGREQVLAYCTFWRDTHTDGQVGDKCLIVKLGAEVSDLSERMRVILKTGTTLAVNRLTQVVEAGQNDGSVASSMEPHDLATAVYQLWLGATLMAMITHSSRSFDYARVDTVRFLDHT
ncbi:TetR/AcrR family transcriptional repressor of nem operon [Acetobacter oeni]|nr:TetR/AcrR family transcriptional repressor of nem operon [Acetobacter oeni]